MQLEGETQSFTATVLAARQSVACMHIADSEQTTEQHLLPETYHPDRNCNNILKVQKMSSEEPPGKGTAPCPFAGWHSQERSHTTCCAAEVDKPTFTNLATNILPTEHLSAAQTSATKYKTTLSVHELLPSHFLYEKIDPAVIST